ncbi:MAG: ABC-F family ATP-binding cassette domain-containing protein [Lachnospiraceae bacterium]|nr:ABC-F family ATP-binding cassette domain-containing protein [Lachnospiraceae bacterium]
MLLACREIQKTFHEEPVLKGGYFHLEEKEKAAVVGINGAGKTTLLNVITGVYAPDGGEVILTKDARLGYLKQHQEISSDATIYDEVASARADIFEMERQLRVLEAEMAGKDGEALAGLMEEYSRLSHRFEDEGGYALRSEIAGVIKGLGFSEEDFGKPCRVLSGGEKTRVALGKLLLSRPDLILLDEPTNHLDIRSVAWLEGYLKDYPGAVLIVSHDRYFMDRVVTKIIEVELGRVSMYSGNYTAYAAKKAAERQIALKHYINQQKVIKHEEEVIAKLKSFNREKSIKRAESREKRLDMIERLEKPQEVRDAMHLTLASSSVSGEQVLEVRDLSKGFGTRTLFAGLDFTVRRGEKTAIIGDNGTGKTSLLKIVTGALTPDTGSVRLGAQVRTGYYDQEQHLFDESNTLFDEFRLSYPRMTDTEIRNTLASFLFTGDDVFKPISILSGGEKGRLSLAKLMLSPCNFLILDEPTNHLDITSREILEEALSRYEGTLLFVSHDRYFINRLAGRILELDGCTLTEYAGNYDYYLEKKAQMRDAASSAAGSDAAGPASETDAAREWRNKKEADAQRRKKENDLKRCEEAIEQAEAALARLEAQMASPEVAVDPVRLMALDKEAGDLRARLEELYSKWEELA